MKHFRVYLYGHKCKVYTDHEALLLLMNHPHPSGKLARWGLALQKLDLVIHYQPGKLNQLADSLSRSWRNDLGQAAEKHLASTKDSEESPENHLASAKDREESPGNYLASARDMEEIPENHFVSVGDKETALSKRQASDPELAMVIKVAVKRLRAPHNMKPYNKLRNSNVF